MNLPRVLLPLLALGISTLLVAAESGEEIGWRGGEPQTVVPQPGTTADMGTAPRVDVDRPKPFFMLRDRDKRVHGLIPFQQLVDAAPAGSVLKPPPGIYAGPVRVDKPLTIDGGGQVTIDAGDKGTVFELRTDGAVLTGLRLTGSGESHDTDDSCLDVRGHNNRIENLVIDNCLFGIDLKQSSDSTLRGNKISSKPFDLGIRGDGLRLWYSHRNLIENNEVVDTRDMVAWYSNDNIFRGNIGKRSRYSIHFMFANNNIVENNLFHDNAVGIYFMYMEGGAARNNVISHATGAAGMAFGFKESSNIEISGNEIIYCAVGVGSDLSPFQPDTSIRFSRNRFAYNGIAVQFTSELGGNVLTDNIFEGNLTDVFQGGRGSGDKNRWSGNYYDTYQGFDRDNNGVGDTPHENYAYADRLWMEIPAARFFRTSPVLELLDFLERLAPFSTPEMQMRDANPRFTKPETGRA
jgi:nitrous oxidase accessory protein